MSERFEIAMANFSAALSRFEAIVATPRENDYLVDAAIQRFEFTVETAWKTLAVVAGEQGLPSAGPRMFLESAYKLGLIDDDGGWTTMLQDRNLSTHTYKQDLAEDLYSRLPRHLERFKALAAKLAAHAVKS